MSAQATASMSSYRQTFLRLADNCPHSAKLYLDTGGSTRSDVNDGGVTAHPLMRGRAFHEFAERALRELSASGERQISEAHAKQILLDVLAQPELIVPVADVELLRIAVTHFARDFELPGTEVHFETPVAVNLGLVEVTGTIDLWWRDGGVIHMRDWKCGYGIPAQGDVSSVVNGMHRGAKAFQLVVYALLHEATFGEPGVTWYDCRFVYPLFDGLPTRDVLIHRDEMAGHGRWLETLVARTHAYAVANNWPAVPGDHCRFCPAPERCPIPQDLRPVDDLSLYQDGPLAYALAGWDLDRQLKRVKATLKGHVEDYGPLRVGEDLEWAFRTSQRDVRDEHGAISGSTTSTRFGLFKRSGDVDG